MKFEKLNDNKIRILLSIQDMEDKNVSVKSFFSDKSTSENIIQLLLKEAEKEIDFKTGDSELLVEAISLEKGFIFTITKLPLDNDTSSSNLIFKFDCFDHFLDLYTCLKNTNIDLKYISKYCSLIYYDNFYYLYIKNVILPDNFLNLLNDFANQIRYSPKLDGMLHEYGKMIAKKCFLHI